VEITEVNGPDIKSENTFGREDVRAVTRTATAQGDRYEHSFPPHSYTMLKARLS
jgi:alpha-N-arabinofuranosidase